MKPALIVIDVQNAWLSFSDGLKKSVDERISNITEAISIFRRAGAPVIFTFHSYSERGIVPETQGFNLLPNIVVKAGDEQVVKTHQNAFMKTELARIIRDKGCDTVILVGLSALNCVLSTYLAAYDEGFFPYIVRGAVAGPDDESIQIAEKICDTLSLRAISQILGQAPQFHVRG